jgi:hypothetical protein
VIGNIGSTFEGVQSLIYETMNRIQTQISEDFLCIEESEDIQTSSGQEFYDFPDEFITERKLILDEGSTELKLITLDEVERLKRTANENPDWTADTPVYYYKWENQFGFLGYNGAVPDGEENTITVYYYKTAYDDIMSDTVDPVLSHLWDTAIRLGTLADLLGSDKWQEKYEIEIARRGAAQSNRRAEVGQILPTGDYE